VPASNVVRICFSALLFAVIAAGAAHFVRHIRSEGVAVAASATVGGAVGAALALAWFGVGRAELGRPEALAVAMSTLDATPPFSTLPRSLKQSMAEGAEISVCSAGERVVEQGAEGDSCFVVRRGRLSVHISDGDRAIQVAVLRDGDLFGEMSLLTGERRWATVRAEEESEVVRMHASVLRKALIQSPELVQVLAETVSMRQDELLRARELLERVAGRSDLPQAIRSFLTGA
jgi:CRP-like cAMP-binding protein